MMMSSALQISISVVSGFAAIMNTLLIPIIISTTQNGFGIYKFFMLALTIVALACAMLIILTLPMATTTFNGILYFNTVSYFTKWINDILLCCYIVGYIMWSTILIYSFIYRTLAVRQKETVLFAPAGYAVLTGLIAFICVLYAKIIYAFPASQEIMAQMRDRVQRLTGLEITQLSCLGGAFTNDDGTFGSGFFMSLSLASYAIPQIIIMTICVYLFYSYISRETVFASLSKATQSRQKRLFMHLISQTITPICFTSIPILIEYAASLFALEMSDSFNVVLSSLLPVAHVMDPVWMLIFIREYRNGPYNFFKRVCCGFRNRVHNVAWLNQINQ